MEMTLRAENSCVDLKIPDGNSCPNVMLQEVFVWKTSQFYGYFKAPYGFSTSVQNLPFLLSVQRRIMCVYFSYKSTVLFRAW